MDERNLDPQGWDVLHKHESVAQARATVRAQANNAQASDYGANGGSTASGYGNAGYGNGNAYAQQNAGAQGSGNGGVFKILTAVFGILALGFGGVLAVLALGGSIKMNNTSTGSTETESEVAQVSEEEQKKIVEADTGAEVRALVTEVHEELDKFLESKDLNYWAPKVFNEGVPAYKFDDTSVYTTLERSYGFVLSDARLEKITMAEDGVSAVVAKSLKEKGFEDYIKEETVVYPIEVYNKESEIVCELDSRSFPWSMSCAHTSWISEEKKALVNGLAEALKKSDEKLDEGDFISADIDDIESGEGDYQRIQAAVANAAGLFWRKDKDSEWNLFKITQNGVMCEDFKKADLKKAYSGYECYDSETGKTTTVK